VARYGGEELIVVLFGADRAHAATISTAVLDSVRELRIPHLGSLTRPYVTASVGAATLEPGADYSHDLAVQLADRALYAAKERGRDCWAFYDPSVAGGGCAPMLADSLLKTAS
jgi:diguanylate cyclase (GGDEF)-like protein